jgi:hypothetical protein
MPKDYVHIQVALADFLKAWIKLKALGIVNNKKDFTSQLGEFIVANFYEGRVALNSIQKYWDVELNDGNKIQVKTHAKATTNKNQWTAVPYLADARIDLFVIVVFTEDYKLKHFFSVPWSRLFELSVQDITRRLVRWNRLTEFDKISDSKFKNHDLIKLFL